MNGKDSGWDLSDLEREIEAAVDKLFVEKKSQTDPVAQPKGTSPSIQTRPTAPATVEKKVAPRKLQEKLEEVEAQLLTLEWDLNSKHINRAINLLQDLRGLPFGGEELKEVVILIQRVLYQLLLDENKLTPAALKFLQKSWKAVKGMTDERFSFDIDKKALVKELEAEFQRLKIEEEVPRERKEEVEEIRVTRRPPETERVSFEEEKIIRRPPERKISLEEIKKLIDRVQKLERVVIEERKRWEDIHREITSYKTELQRIYSSEEEAVAREEEEIVELDERLEGGGELLDLEPQPAKVSIMAVSIFEASGVLFGFPEDQILRSFPVRKWVADFFIESGRVKLKEREIPLLNLFHIFRLKPSTEENPLVLLIRVSEDRLAAVIVDQAVSREQIEYQPIKDKPYVLGKGIWKAGEVWIIDTGQITP